MGLEDKDFPFRGQAEDLFLLHEGRLVVSFQGDKKNEDERLEPEYTLKRKRKNIDKKPPIFGVAAVSFLL